MEADAEDLAYDALSQHPRITDMVAVARSLMAKAVETRTSQRDADAVARLLAEHHLERADGATPRGNVVEALGSGAGNASERALLCALAAHVVAKNPPESAEDEARLAGDLLWLAAHTPFDATGLLDRALGERATVLWAAVADRIQRIGDGQGAPLDRGAALVGAVALRSSRSKDAAKHLAALAARVSDPKVADVLAGAGSAAESPTPVVGEIVPAPRGPVATALLAASGVLLVLHAARTFGRIALAYRRPAEIRLSEDGGLRVHWRTEVLGRSLGDRDILVPRSGLAQATREVRYPRLALYAGLLALAVGSYAGVSAFVDGVRAASPSLLGAGLVIAILGIAVDFVLSSVVPGTRARCSVVLIPRRGKRLCVGGVDMQAADAMLARVGHR